MWKWFTNLFKDKDPPPPFVPDRFRIVPVGSKHFKIQKFWSDIGWRDSYALDKWYNSKGQAKRAIDRWNRCMRHLHVEEWRNRNHRDIPPEEYP